MHAAVCHDDEEDPLGILGGLSCRKRSTDDSPPTLGPDVAWGVVAPAKVDCSMGDPREVIDVILRMSKEARDRVSSRQAHVLDVYTAESHQLEKELALLPRTYSQYVAVREKANSRRRQRRAAETPALVSHPLKFHLHAGREGSPRFAERCSPRERGESPPGALAVEDEPIGRPETGEGGGRRVSWGTVGATSDGGEGDPDSPLPWPGGHGHVEEFVGAGGANEGTLWHGDYADRRCSTRARAGSASANFIARPLTSCQEQAEAPLGDRRGRQLHNNTGHGAEGGVTALRRSKVRGRQMVFSLLEASHAEEEEMESRFYECSVAPSAGDCSQQHQEAFRELDEARVRNARELNALMAEYDPRPSKCRREHTLVKLRMALPYPDISAAPDAAGSGRNESSFSSASTHPRTSKRKKSRATGRHRSYEHASPRHPRKNMHNHGGDAPEEIALTEGVEERRADTVEGGDGGGDTRDARCELGEEFYTRGEEGQVGDDRGGGGYVDSLLDDKQDPALETASRHDCFDRLIDDGDGGGGVVRQTVERDDGRGGDCRPVSNIPGGRMPTISSCAEYRDVASDASGVVVGDRIGVGQGPAASRSSTTSVEEGVFSRVVDDGGDVGRKNGGDAPQGPTESVVTNGLVRLRPNPGQKPKKPTLPDPNEVNSAVLADHFNMDHMKDLPGLVGGADRELSILVAEAVTPVDPAFPNLEFHRRAAMDRAGYFMPGYKPRVNTPGLDAGAYWLARRQSYRVKMAVPSHQTTQSSSHEDKRASRRLLPSPHASKQRHTSLRRARASDGITGARSRTRTTTLGSSTSKSGGNIPGVGSCNKRAVLASTESPSEGSHMRDRGTGGKPVPGGGRGTRPTKKGAEEGTRNGRDRTISRGDERGGASGDRGDVTNDWRRDLSTEP